MQISNVSSTEYRYQKTQSKKSLEENAYTSTAISLTKRDNNNQETGINSNVLDLFAKEQKLSNITEQSSEEVTSVPKEDYSNVRECSVVSLFSTDVSFYYYHDTGEMQCIDDTNSSPGRQVLWSKVLSEEDYESCAPLFEKYRKEAHWEYKYENYLKHEFFWDMYLNDEFDIKTLNDVDKVLADDKLFERVFQDTPDSVKKAWDATLADTGNAFSMNSVENINYFSELYRQIFCSMIRGSDVKVLGKTEDSAVAFAQDAIENLKNVSGYSSEMIRMREKEREFYEKFISNLQGRAQ